MRTSRSTERIALEDGTEAVVKPLSWSEYQEAEEADSASSLAMVAKLPVEALAAIRDVDSSPEAIAAAREKTNKTEDELLAGLDLGVVLQRGLVEYVEADGVKLSSEAELAEVIADLDRPTGLLVGRRIAELSGRTESEKKD